MKRAVVILTLGTVLVFGTACNADRSADDTNATSDPRTPLIAASASEFSPEQLGEIAARIRKEPTRADEILAEHRLTEEVFEEAVRKLTENVDESKRYAAAYRKASS